MSINNQKIIDLCKKEKRMVLYSYGQMQWIGVGGAAYPLLKVPHLDEDTVKAIYSLPDGMTVQEKEGLPPHLSFANEDRAEHPVFMEKIQLNPSPDRLLTLCGRRRGSVSSRSNISSLWRKGRTAPRTCMSAAPHRDRSISSPSRG